MINLKEKLLGGWLGDRLLTEARVIDVARVGDLYRHIAVEVDGGGAGGSFAAGDKIQVYLPGAGARTYTPFTSRSRGAFDFLVYLHGEAPGAAWARSLVVGDRLRFIGPRTSLPLATFGAPCGLFGDETSLAIAGSLLETHGPRARALVEVTHLDAARDAAAIVGLPRDAIVERVADAALRDALASRLMTEADDASTLVLTGSAQRIQRARAALRLHGTGTTQKVKAYWSSGKRGLD